MNLAHGNKKVGRRSVQKGKLEKKLLAIMKILVWESYLTFYFSLHEIGSQKRKFSDKTAESIGIVNANKMKDIFWKELNDLHSERTREEMKCCSIKGKIMF